MSASVVHCLAAICAGIASLGTATADPVDDAVIAEMQRQHLPGVSIAVVRDGRIVKEKGYGVANVEHDVPVTPSTVFQSGSVGKQFTAALVLLLVADGKLGLDEPLSAYLPESPEAWAKITVRQVLTHTSGMPSADPSIDLHRDYSEDELLRAIARVPLRFQPGEQWGYSNLGYEVLGILCSRVGGKFYGDQLRERIFDPVGMHTRIISERDIVPHRAAGYDRVNGVLRNQEWVASTLNTTADGSLYLTADDLARWSVALDGERILSRPMKELSWTPARLNDGSATDYGFGWELRSRGGHRRIEHGGAWQGFTSQLTRFPDDRLAVIVLINRSRAHPHLIVDKIAAHYVPDLRPAAEGTAWVGALASVPVFLRGSMNDWGLRDRMRDVGHSAYEAEIALGQGPQQFRIASGDWEAIDLGARFDEPETTLDQDTPLEVGGDNLVVEVPQPAPYVFRIDARDPHHPLIVVRRRAGPP